MFSLTVRYFKIFISIRPFKLRKPVWKLCHISISTLLSNFVDAKHHRATQKLQGLDKIVFTTRMGGGGEYSFHLP